MAHDDLQTNIDVIVNVEKAHFPKSVYGGIFSIPERVINWKLNRAKTEIAPNVGRYLSEMNKKAQQSAIISLDAIYTRALFGSITIKGGRGSRVVHYRVGTNLRKKYPHYVVYGRGAVKAKNVRFLKFVPKGESEPIYRKSVKGADPKNYPTLSDSLFEPTIPSIVEREVQRVLGR